MKAIVYKLDGTKAKELELPKVFESEVDVGLIKRTVLSIQSAKLQPKGNYPLAGRDNTAKYVGSRGKPTRHRTINVGHARLPRLRNRRGVLYGNVASVPQAVGGTKAHPPKTEKKVFENINRKEKKKATKSAIAATADIEMVKARGHRFDEKRGLPLVVVNDIEKLDKTKKVKEMLKALNVLGDVERAKKRKKVRAGKGKKRGRLYKRAKSILIVAKDSDKIYAAARNFEGIDVVNIENLNAELLAPGCKAGRLTIWSEAAINAL